MVCLKEPEAALLAIYSRRAGGLPIAVAADGTGDGDGGMHLWIYPGNEELGDLHHTRHMAGPGSAPFRPCPHPGLATGVGKTESCVRRGGWRLHLVGNQSLEHRRSWGPLSLYF